MSYNGSGQFNRIYDWTDDRDAGVKILATRMDTEMDGMATGLSTAICKDGQTTITANLPMSGYKFTGLAAGSGAGHSVRWEQLFGGASKDAELTVASSTPASGSPDILGAASDLVCISGTTTVTSLGTGTNKIKFLRFSGALILTHNATSLILPGGANITTAAGDTCIVESDGSSNARIFAYQRADGSPIGSYQPLDADLTAIGALAKTDGNVIVGDGATWVAESGATARTSLGAATTSQTDQISGAILGSLSNRSYTIVVDTKIGFTITEVTTQSVSGTATATWKINSTALGGTANSVSSSETTQAHASNNVAAAGDNIVLTISANSSCVDLYFNIKTTRTLS